MVGVLAVLYSLIRPNCVVDWWLLKRVLLEVVEI
jgi:hypothetical protein